jgi:hypothetical protein
MEVDNDGIGHPSDDVTASIQGDFGGDTVGVAPSTSAPTTTAASTATASTTTTISASSDHEIQQQQRQQERRNSIRSIMADETLTPLEKRRTIQSMMDGRSQASRRGSMGSVGATASRRGSVASQSSFSSIGSTGHLHQQPPPGMIVQQQPYHDPYSSSAAGGRPSDVVMMPSQVGGTNTTEDGVMAPTHQPGNMSRILASFQLRVWLLQVVNRNLDRRLCHCGPRNLITLP